MINQDPFLTRMTLRIHRGRIESQLPAAARNLCRQIAWSIRVRLPFLVATADWESRLRREVRLSLEQHRTAFGGMDVEKMTQLVLLQCAEDLAIQCTGTPRGLVSKKDIDTAKETVKNKLDSLSEMGEMESLRLQMAMDRLSKLMSTLSNLLMKASETSSGITQNVK